MHKKSAFLLAWALVAPVFVSAQFSFWQASVRAADGTVESDKQVIEDKKDSIADLEKELKKEMAEKAKLEQNLGQIQSSVTATQREINKTQELIRKAEGDIARKQSEIAALEEKNSLQTEILRNIVKELYYARKATGVNAVLAGGDFADALSSSDHLIALQERIRNITKEIGESKEKIVQEKQQLAGAVDEHEDLLEAKAEQKQDLLADKAEVASDVAEKEVTIGELNEKLAELQGDLNKLTGKSYNAGDIREAVEYASGKTGVPKGVLYGFLKMETNLGANTGQCTYKEVERVSVARYKKYGTKYKNSIALLYKRQELFYDLVDDLGYGKNKKVSCSPSGYIGQGGAMGIPQFMSDVWKSYSPQIASKTGHAIPDPWNLTDGVMAMALKLQKAGATSDSASAIRKASINYLGTFYANYYNGIVYWSKNYKRLFN